MGDLRQYLVRANTALTIFAEDLDKLVPITGLTDIDGWYFGTLPSRHFIVVGTLLSATAYENVAEWRIKYLVDDSTGDGPLMFTEDFKKSLRKVTPTSLRLAASLKAADRRTERRQKPKYEEMAEPKTLEPGSLVRVNFRVRLNKSDKANVSKTDRYCNMDTIEQIRPHEELDHWRKVIQLHRADSCNPFIVPKLVAPATPSRSRVSSPSKSHMMATPSSMVGSSPLHVSETPTKSENALLARHPASISSASLTQKTFGLYLLYFMRHDKGRPPLSLDIDDRNATPRPFRKHLIDRSSRPNSKSFSCDYLRSTPDLRFLARRVVLAVARRTAWAAYQAERPGRDGQSQSTTVSRSRIDGALTPTDNRPSTSATTRGTTQLSLNPSVKRLKPFTPASLGRAMCRLFETTLRTLLSQGDIVLGSGPSRNSEISSDPLSIDSYPACIGDFHVWGPPTSINSGRYHTDGQSLMKSTGRSSTSTSNNRSKTWRTGLDDNDAPIDIFDPPLATPGEEQEVFEPFSPECLSEPVLRLLRRQTQVEGMRASAICNSLTVAHREWKFMKDWHILQCLELLESEDKVERVKVVDHARGDDNHVEHGWMLRGASEYSASALREPILSVLKRLSARSVKEGHRGAELADIHYALICEGKWWQRVQLGDVKRCLESLEKERMVWCPLDEDWWTVML